MTSKFANEKTPRYSRRSNSLPSIAEFLIGIARGAGIGSIAIAERASERERERERGGIARNGRQAKQFGIVKMPPATETSRGWKRQFEKS